MITYYSHYRQFVTKLLEVIDRNVSTEIIDVITKSILKKGVIDLSLHLPKDARADFLENITSAPEKSDAVIQTLFDEQLVNTTFEEAGIFILQTYFDESTPLSDQQLAALNQVVAA